MNRRIFLFFSHRLTPDQETDLRERWGVAEILSLPGPLQDLWSSIPPDLPQLGEYLRPLASWLEKEGRMEDLILVHGDFGAVCLVVQEASRLGLTPIYATTRRMMQETMLPNGEVRQERIFKHERFRIYGR